MTYRDAGFLPEAYVNFLCLLGWNPKDDREKLSIAEITSIFSFEGVNRSNAVVNFTDADPIDPKALWLNSQHLFALSTADLAARLAPVVAGAGFQVEPAKLLAVTPLIQERIKTLCDVVTVADFFFKEELPPYDPAELIPQKGDAEMAKRVLACALATLEQVEFKHDPLDAALRAAASSLGVKAGQMFQPIRVAACGRKNAPPLFETLEVLGREWVLERLRRALALLG